MCISMLLDVIILGDDSIDIEDPLALGGVVEAGIGFAHEDVGLGFGAAFVSTGGSDATIGKFIPQLTVSGKTCGDLGGIASN